MVTLFRDLDDRVVRTVARMRGGERVTFQDDPKASLSVADVVDRIPDRVSRRADLQALSS